MKGYAIDVRLSSGELDVVREMVRARWLARLEQIAQQAMPRFHAIEMDAYHTASHLIDHKLAWTNRERILPAVDVATIKALPSFARFRHLADEANLGHENILWRIVRPGADDITPLHADRDFGNVTGECFNVWIALYATPCNGLRVIPRGESLPVNLPLFPGDGVRFDHDLIHGGAINDSSKTRVSIEFTVMGVR